MLQEKRHGKDTFFRYGSLKDVPLGDDLPAGSPGSDDLNWSGKEKKDTNLLRWFLEFSKSVHWQNFEARIRKASFYIGKRMLPFVTTFLEAEPLVMSSAEIKFYCEMKESNKLGESHGSNNAADLSENQEEELEYKSIYDSLPSNPSKQSSPLTYEKETWLHATSQESLKRTTPTLTIASDLSWESPPTVEYQKHDLDTTASCSYEESAGLYQLCVMPSPTNTVIDSQRNSKGSGSCAIHNGESLNNSYSGPWSNFFSTEFWKSTISSEIIEKPKKKENYFEEVYAEQRSNLWTDKGFFVVALTAALSSFNNFARFPHAIFIFGAVPYALVYFALSFCIFGTFIALEIAIGQTTKGGVFKYLDLVSSRGRGLGVMICIVSLILAIGESFNVVNLLIFMSNSLTLNFPWRSNNDQIVTCKSTQTAHCPIAGPNCNYNAFSDNCAVNQVTYAISFLQGEGFESSWHWNYSLAILSIVLLSTISLNFCRMSLFVKMGIWNLSVAGVVLCFLLSYSLTFDRSASSLDIFLESFKIEKLQDPKLWCFTAVDIILSFSLGLMVIAKFAGFNKQDFPPVRCAVALMLINFMSFIIISVATYPYLRYLRIQTSSFGIFCISLSPSYMLYSVIPLAISFLPGAPAISFLFFLATAMLSFESSLSKVYTVTHELRDVAGFLSNTFRKVFTLLPVLTSLVAFGILISQLYEEFQVLWISCIQIGLPTLVLMICIMLGWLGNTQGQVNEVGVKSVLFWGLSFLVINAYCLLSLLIFFRNAKPGDQWSGNINNKLAGFWISIIASLNVALYLAYKFRLKRFALDPDLPSHVTNRIKRRAFSECAWWLLLGNIDCFRTSLNDIPIKFIVEASPEEIESDRVIGSISSSQQPYLTRVQMLFKLYLIPRIASIYIKYVIPEFLLLTLLVQFYHVSPLNKLTDELQILAYIMVSEASRSAHAKYYYLVFTTLWVGFFFSCICPGAFWRFSPKYRIAMHQEVETYYDPSLKDSLKTFLYKFRELNPKVSQVNRAD